MKITAPRRKLEIQPVGSLVFDFGVVFARIAMVWSCGLILKKVGCCWFFCDLCDFAAIFIFMFYLLFSIWMPCSEENVSRVTGSCGESLH